MTTSKNASQNIATSGSPDAPGSPARRRADDLSPDLVAFLVFHSGLRRDFGRLADALDRCAPGDARRRALIDEHTALLLRALHHHHSGEDEDIWPMLRTLVPGAGPTLDRLEADHQEMDTVIERLAATGTAAPERARDLRSLHTLLGPHLDLEEAEVVPLIREHVSAAWWDEIGKKVNKNHGRDLPMIAAWIVDVASPEEREHIFATAPAIMRVLYRLSWRRAYERRMARILG
ncbi:hemerythrin domain-containing protein [Streptosporangium sp. NPDC051023]|uniref:hemerythrin domain-containing protein n=1 Tax=Streptosporangium sp. NPDC051023 TaxID=3155410 RepID=UPI00344B5077